MNKFLLLLLFSAVLSAKEKILICGVCQNIASKLPLTIKNMETCGKTYDDYQIIIYENNSRDNTPQLLRKWAKRNPKVLVFTEKLSQRQLLSYKGGIGRMEIIAFARNKVLKEAMRSAYKDFDFVLMADMDFTDPWDIKEIVRTTSRKDIEWDGVFANGIVSTKRDHYALAPAGALYDLYAYRAEDHPLCIESLGPIWWGNLRWRVIPKNAPWQPVYSAFGGLGIYKRKSLKGSFYSGTVTPDLEIAVKRWLAIAEKQKHPYIDLYQGSQDELVWFNARGTGFLPEVCEHVALHASMSNKGFDKFFINPKLITRYYG